MYLIFTPYIIGDDIKYGRSPNSDTYLKSVPWASSVFFRPTRIDDVNLIKIRTLHLLNFFLAWTLRKRPREENEQVRIYNFD